MIQLGVLWYSYFGELWTATVQMTQHPKLQNVDFWRQNGPKRGPQTKIWQLIWNQGPKISMIPNFEGFTLNNKNFKKLTFRGSRGQSGGSKPNFFNWYEIRTPKWVLYQILKVLRSKTKISKFWPFGGSGGQTGAPNRNFSTDTKCRPQNLSNLKCLRS